MRNLPGRHSDEPGPCQSRTDQRIEVIGAKPGWNAQRSSHCAVLETPFRHAWHIAEGQAVVLDQVVRRSSSRGFFGATRFERDGDYDSSAVLRLPRDQPYWFSRWDA